MSNKTKKYEIELKNKELEAEQSKSQNSQEEVSFDSYFQKLVKRNPNQVMAHHKAPMRKFAETFGAGEKASIERYEEIFKRY
jgi:hypothetical protein